MNLKPVYFACKLLLGVTLIVCIAVASFVGWLLYSPRDISQFNETLIAAMNPARSGFSIRIEKTLLKWEDWRHPAVIDVKNLAIEGQGEGAFMLFPDVLIRLNMWDAFLGKIVPQKLEIQSPELTIVKNKDGQWLWVGQNAKSLPLEALLAPAAGAQNTVAFKTPFEHLEISDAKIHVYLEAQDRSLVLKNVLLGWQMDDESAHAITVDAELELNDHIMASHAQFQISPNGTPYAQAKLWLKSANLNWLCSGWIDCAELPIIDMAMDIDLAADMNRQFEPIAMTYDVKGEAGSIAFKPHLPETLKLDHFIAKGAVDIENTQLALSELLLKFGKTEISGAGDIAQKTQGIAVNFDGTAKMMPVNDLGKYWPATLAPASREWAITSIRGGMAELGTASLRIAAGDLDKDVFPDECLKSYVKVKNTTVEYLKDFPKATNASGEVMFTGTTMKADIVAANAMTGSKIDKAHLFFTDLNHPNTPVEATLSLKSPAEDVIKFLQPPYLDVLAKIPADFKSTTGDTQGDIKLKFDAFGEHSKDGKINWDKVQYDVDSTLANMDNIVLDKGMVVQGAKGTFKGSNTTLNFQGEGMVNGQKLVFGYKEEGADKGVYQVKGMLSEAILASAGLASSDVFKGAIGVDATIEHSLEGYSISGDADLSKTEINIIDIGYQKPVGQAASLSIKPDTASGYSAILFTAADASATGKIKINPVLHQLEAMQLDRLEIGKTDLSEINYVKSEAGDQLAVKGALLDLSAMPEDDKKSQSISQFPAINLTLDLREVRLPKEQGLRNLKADVVCNTQRCESAEVAAKFLDKGDLSMRIYREGGIRKFLMRSNNAGNVARTVDAVDEMIGGTLEVRGDYDDSKAGNPLNGRFTIMDYVLKDAPLLGSILNLSSLTGLMQTLTGQGMKFDKLSTDFTFANDVFEMKNAKATGPSLGIVTKGTIDIAESTLDLDGNLAPIQIINSFIGKIPLVGQILAGGEGQSIFAFSFSIKGSHDDPKVSVNPLSVLTPGFTRKFFDLFDAPKPAEIKTQSQSKSTTEPSAPVPLMVPAPLQPVPQLNKQIK
jgi:uncharacterized protein YhdP